MKPFKNLFRKPASPAGKPPSPDAMRAAPAASTDQPPRQKSPPVPLFVKMPAGLMQELFPARDVMVSVIFGEAKDAAAALPAATAIPPELPKSEPQPRGTAETPEVLSISDELREAIFPTQKVMVSVIFNGTTPPPIAREPGRQHWSGDDPRAEDESGRRHDFPII